MSVLCPLLLMAAPVIAAASSWRTPPSQPREFVQQSALRPVQAFSYVGRYDNGRCKKSTTPDGAPVVPGTLAKSLRLHGASSSSWLALIQQGLNRLYPHDNPSLTREYTITSPSSI